MSPPSPPASITDPYAPEPSSVSPVYVRLVRKDYTIVTKESDARVMRQHAIIVHDGIIFDHRSDDFIAGKWYRTFCEADVVSL
jgi:hypothetical protein